MRGCHVFGMAAFVFHVKREEEEGGAGWSSGKKGRRYEIVSLLTYHSLKI